MIYRLLGELEIGRDGQLLDLPNGHTLTVLAALLLNANRRMSKTDLIRAVWGNDDVKEAQLHKRVKEARDILTHIGRQGDIKTFARFGYGLMTAPEDVDSLLFQRWVLNADEAAVQGRTGDEIDHLRRALRLWRGPRPLSNVPSNSFYHDIEVLEQRHRRAAVRLFDLELASGNDQRILDELIQVASIYPADQRLCGQLMTVARRGGLLLDATRAYERYRDAIASETGGEPDPRLRSYYFAIARNDAGAMDEAEAALDDRAARPAPPAVAAPRQLPPAVDLIGRQHLAAEVKWLLNREPARVVVISGPGGIGKTALALHAAHQSAGRYPDGQLYAELRGTAGGAPDTSEILAQFLRALGAARVPESKAERLAMYRTLLASRRVLVVLDDAAGGEQVADLIPANPACGAVITARQRLPDLSGAHHLPPLEPLGPADATELFLRVVRDSGVNVDSDLDAVGTVVALCGGLPLAVRIAGALRVHYHPRPTSELAERLAAMGPEAFAYGGRSVARTISAGFDRLDAAERQLFLGLGLLPLTTFGLWTAAALLGGTGGGPDPDSAAALAQLAASFMIEPAPSAARYCFHDLTRDYARRRALEMYGDGRDEVPARAYRALLTLARHAHARLYGGAFEVVHSAVPDSTVPAEAIAEIDASPLGWFDAERLNIRAAVEHCAVLGLAEVCWDLAVSAHEFYGIRGYFDDWHATHMLAKDACNSTGDPRGLGIVLACLNQPALVASRRASGESSLGELRLATDLLAACGDRHGLAIAQRTLANALRRQGHLRRPLKIFTDALGHYSASEDTVGQWQAMRFIGQTYLDLGRCEDARRVLGQAQAVAEKLGLLRDRLIGQTRYWIGQACLADRDLESAQVEFDAVYDLVGEVTGLDAAYAAHGLGDVARFRGAYQLADRQLARAVDLAHDGGDATLEARALMSAAELRQAQGRRDEQVEALKRAVTVLAGCGVAYLEVQALAALAAVQPGQHADELWALIERHYAEGNVPDEDRLRRPAAG